MSKSYRPWAPRQAFLLPPSPLSWLPEEHLAYFVLDVVENALDLGEITGPIQMKDPRGNRPFHPSMMTSLLLYAYCVGVPSSRKIEQATYTDVAFRVLAGGAHPDHTVISEFRRENLTAMAGLFLQILKLCQKAGLVKLGHVALDGTKVKANASKHKAMSYERMLKTEAELEQEIAKLLESAEATDQKDDLEMGLGQKEGALPEELRRRENRLKVIRKAKAALEADAAATRALEKQEQAKRAKQKAEQAEKDKKEREEALASKRQAEAAAAATLARQKAEQRVSAAAEEVKRSAEAAETFGEKRAAGEAAKDLAAGRRDQAKLEERLAGVEPTIPEHRVPADKEGSPGAKAQRNFTDPDSRIMVSGQGSYVQAFNCQAVACEGTQIIVAHAVGNQSPDSEYFGPMLLQVEANCGALPEKMSADNGYWSAENDALSESRGVDHYIAVGRERHGQPETASSAEGSTGAAALATGEEPRKKRMREKLLTEAGRSVYSRRKVIVEPVFGQIKEARGIRGFLLRGIEKTRAEWALICGTHDLLKLFCAQKRALAVQM